MVNWLIEDSGVGPDNTEVKQIIAVGWIAIDGPAVCHKSHVGEDGIKYTIQHPDPVCLIAIEDRRTCAVEVDIGWIDFHVRIIRVVT